MVNAQRAWTIGEGNGGKIDLRLFDKQVRINLALQGGGAHGAFTWGVLDRLLEEDSVEIAWVSATSAGAVNAAALAGGLVEGGRAGGREMLRRIWHAVHKAGVTDLLRMNPFLYGLMRTGGLAHMTSTMSPYDFNPLDFNPLRRLLNENIDFGRVRAESPIELLIAATAVATGKVKLFRRRELDAEMVLASTCLPTLHHAIQINGAAYWDGGFSANPDILTLAQESPVEDTLIVQLTPLVETDLPTRAREIAAHVNRLTFNAPLTRQAEVIETARAAGRSSVFGRPKGPGAGLVRHRFHLIEATRYTATLAPDSKLKPDMGLFTYLHGAGRTETHKWLERNRKLIGRRGTVDLAQHFLNPKVPDPLASLPAPIRSDDEIAPSKTAAGN